MRALVLCLLATGAMADPAQDLATVQACAEIAPEEGGICIGRLADDCTVDAGDWTADKALACDAREEAAWTALGAAALVELDGLFATLPDAVAAVHQGQEAWAQYRDTQCRAILLAWEGGEDGALNAAQCRLGKAADRALELRGMTSE